MASCGENQIGLTVFGNTDLLDIICSSLSVRDVVRLSLTCRTARDAADVPSVKGEVTAARHLVEDYGFSPDHMELLREYLAKHALSVGSTGGWDGPDLTWEAHAAAWDWRVDEFHGRVEAEDPCLVQWVPSWRAHCTDASMQRALVARPRETIQCEAEYCSSNFDNFAIIQMQAAIDSIDVAGGNRGDISEICSSRDTGTARFILLAPEAPGLYMIRYMPSWHYSYQQAADDQWPKPLPSRPGKFTGSFLAWLRVVPKAASKPAGKHVYLQHDGRPGSVPKDGNNVGGDEDSEEEEGDENDEKVRRWYDIYHSEEDEDDYDFASHEGDSGELSDWNEEDGDD